MKAGVLLAGVVVLLASYFLVPGLKTSVYVSYVGYGLGAVLVLAGLFGKKRFY